MGIGLERGHQIKQINTLSCESKTNFLPFIKVTIHPTLGDAEESEGIAAYCLADTGCSDSVISFNFFDQKLNINGRYSINPSNFVLNLAEQNNVLEVVGETKVIIKLTDEKHNSVAFMHKFLLIKNLNHNVFLGSDLLSSEKVYAKTRNEIIFNKIPGKMYNTAKIKNNDSFIVIPIAPGNPEAKYTNAHVNNIEEVTLRSRMNKNLPGKLDKKTMRFESEMKKIFDEYEIFTEDREELLKDAVASGSFEIPISNYLRDNPRVLNFEMNDFKPYFKTPDELIKLIDMEHLSKKSRAMMEESCRRLYPLFSKHVWHCGRIKDEAFVELNTEKQYAQKYYPIQKSVQPQVTEILNELKKQGVIRDIEKQESCQFVNCLLVGKRKNSNSIRLIADMRLLNLFTKSLVTAYTSPMEILANISSKAKVISVLDIKNAYMSVPIEKKSQRAFSFFGPKKELMCFCHLPNGFRNAGYFLQKNRLKILNDIPVIFCADDIIIYSDIGEEDNIKIVIQVLERLHKEGYKIAAHKIRLATTTVEILGVQYDLGRLSIPEARMKAYEAYKTPKSFKQVKTFLSSVSFFRCFLKNFSQIAHPLIKLSNKANNKADTTEKFLWNEVHEEAFKKIKNLIKNHASNFLPDYSKEFYGSVDASKYAT